jgi:hypothetical protein
VVARVADEGNCPSAEESWAAESVLKICFTMTGYLMVFRRNNWSRGQELLNSVNGSIGIIGRLAFDY